MPSLAGDAVWEDARSDNLWFLTFLLSIYVISADWTVFAANALFAVAIRGWSAKNDWPVQSQFRKRRWRSIQVEISSDKKVPQISLSKLSKLWKLHRPCRFCKSRSFNDPVSGRTTLDWFHQRARLNCDCDAGVIVRSISVETLHAVVCQTKREHSGGCSRITWRKMWHLINHTALRNLRTTPLCAERCGVRR